MATLVSSSRWAMPNTGAVSNAFPLRLRRWWSRPRAGLPTCLLLGVRRRRSRPDAACQRGPPGVGWKQGRKDAPLGLRARNMRSYGEGGQPFDGIDA